MHELAVTQNVLEIALRHARQAGAGRITRIHLVVGQLSSIVDDSVAFYWDFVARGTPAEGAALAFRRLEARFTCQACGNAFPAQGDRWYCPACGGEQVSVTAGQEFYVEAIEVDSDAPAAADASGA
jgi:hydrogenase nickel incorporation protein HypA/HybF